MAIGTYTELQAAVASWLHRSDLTSVIQDCIALAEEKFNRRLRTRHQETTLASTTIASYQIAIPSNTVAVKQLWRVDGSLKYELLASTLEEVIPVQSYEDTATRYAWGATAWEFDGTGTVAGILYRNIPALSGVSTNWLLTNHPSAYLYATLAEAANYSRDADALAMWEARVEALIGEIHRTEKRDEFSGPIAVRAAGAYRP